MKKKIQNKKRSYQVIFILSIICILIGVSIQAYSPTFQQRAQNTKRTPSISEVTAKNISATPSSILKPTLSPSPLPTVEPKLSGYCLHVPVLMYHHVQPAAEIQQKAQQTLSVDDGMFDQHMAYLNARGYTPIFASELVEALKNKSSVPTKSILVTLDDGYRDNFIYAYPILQKYQVKATIMLSTGLMEGPDYLLWSQVEEMGRSNLISYTNHTWSHYALGRGDREKVSYEIETASQQLEQHLGKKIDVFTYPYGSMGPIATAVLQEKGFGAAFSTIPGTMQCDSFILALRRTRIGNVPLSSYGL